MATIYKRDNGYLARVRLKGVEKSKTFRSHADAKEWAAHTESAILNKDIGKVAKYLTFGDLIDRYREEVTPEKRGSRSEILRLNRIKKCKIASVTVENLTPEHFAEWRDDRLQEVKAASVRRELGTLSALCTHAMREWGVMRSNPVDMISKPKADKPRTRRLSDEEIFKLCLACEYDEDSLPEKVMQRVAVAMLFAIETAMRAGEICGLEWKDIDFNRRIAGLEMTKNGYSREVPLSKRAIQLLNILKQVDNGDSVFGLKASVLDVLFRKAKARCGIDDLHFHDTRREALTRMAKKVDVMTLAKISGHRDIRILQNTYYAPDMASVADLLD